MKLKSILNEILNEVSLEEQKEKAEKLFQKLQDEHYRLNYPHPVYRGEKKEIYTWEENTIRKDRIPRDTSIVVDIMVEALEEGVYTNAPQRTKSKFCSTEHSNLTEYGSVYYMFIKENSNVASLEFDAYDNYFREVESSLMRIQFDVEKYEEKYPVLSEFMQEYDWAEWGAGGEGLFDVVKNRWNKIKNEIDLFIEQENISKEDDLWGLTHLDLLDQYFKDMKSGIHDGSQEILVEADSYIIANIYFIDKFFKFDNGTLKKK